LISAFTGGRLSYDMLAERLTALARRSDAAAGDLHHAIRRAEETGRLPSDLAAILINLVPAAAANGGDAELVELDVEALSPENDTLFDEPTVPLLRRANFPVAAENVMPTPEAGLPPTPPMPPAPGSAATAPSAALPDYAEARSKVDDAVLSSLIGNYRGLRENRQGGEHAAQEKPDALDGLLVNYKSARFRSDARRASSGGATEGLKLSKLDDFHRKRAGVGTILRDRFILDREIGRGGMGVVYAAVDRRRLEASSGQPYVALKLLNDDFRSNAEALRTLEAEARKSQSLAHPNIASVYDFDRDRSEIFIVMELLSGMPLSRLLGAMAGQPLPGMQVAAILRGISAGLAHAHQHGVIHSDLKPGNVFVSETDTVKLIDFGLAVAGQGGDGPNLDGLTTTYASPEMFDGATRDPRDDIFALGCIAYQLLTGMHPFGMQPIDEVAKAGRRPEPIEDLDPAAWAAIDRALAFDREVRISTVGEFIAELFEA
jgi:hypothetical protein